MMKLYKYLIYTAICIIYSSSVTYGGEQNPKTQLNDSKKQKHKIIATFELIDQWQATLSVSPLIAKVPGIDGKEISFEHAIYHVDILSENSATEQRIWQYQSPAQGNDPISSPRSFVFGTAVNNNLCLAFLDNAKICFFVLDPNKEVTLYDEESKSLADKNSPNSRILNLDPNNVIVPSRIFTKEIAGFFTEWTVFIDSVFSNENYTVFNLTIKDQKFILRYSVADGKPDYSIYKITDSG